MKHCGLKYVRSAPTPLQQNFSSRPRRHRARRPLSEGRQTSRQRRGAQHPQLMVVEELPQLVDVLYHLPTGPERLVSGEKTVRAAPCHSKTAKAQGGETRKMEKLTRVARLSWGPPRSSRVVPGALRLQVALATLRAPLPWRCFVATYCAGCAGCAWSHRPRGPEQEAHRDLMCTGPSRHGMGGGVALSWLATPNSNRTHSQRWALWK